jgi:mercuric ion transport protein
LALPGFRSSLIAGTLAAIGASLCCVAPLLLLALGIGGAWIGSLTALDPYRPLLVALPLVFLVFAFRGLYRRPARDCATEAACANPVVLRRQRQAFWLVSPWLLVLLAIPWLAPLFY